MNERRPYFVVVVIRAGSAWHIRSSRIVALEFSLKQSAHLSTGASVSVS